MLYFLRNRLLFLLFWQYICQIMGINDKKRRQIDMNLINKQKIIDRTKEETGIGLGVEPATPNFFNRNRIINNYT